MPTELILGFDGPSVIIVCGLIWAVCLYLNFRLVLARRSCGIPLAYAILLTVIHSGALIYLLPWYNPTDDAYLASQGASLFETAVGFAISTVGLIGLLIGIWISDQILSPGIAPSQIGIADPIKFSKWLMGIGATFFFVITPFANRIPSGASIASNGVNLAIVGICLFTSIGMKSNLFNQFRALMTSLSVPGFTMLFMGFVGYGVAAVTEIGCFVIKTLKIRWWAYGLGAILLWVALSFYITYMAGRDKIRETVWRGASFSERFISIAESLLDAQLFDPRNTKHLHVIDMRINQNALVGRSFVHIRDTGGEFAWGESIQIAALAWIPRIIWPDKPNFGGSTGFATKFTGIRYAESTSVGVGMVMEMYANFGIVGTLLGFMIFGILLRYVDHLAASRLSRGQLWDFARFQLIGFAMIQPGGFLAECVASVAAAYVLTRLLKNAFSRAALLKVS